MKKKRYVVFVDEPYYPRVQIMTDDLEFAKKVFRGDWELGDFRRMDDKPREGKYLCEVIEMEVWEE